ncbi:MAG: hypothetical protein V4736_04755 [Bdellovibrionota bacterium]
MKLIQKGLAISASLFFITSCATYQSTVNPAREKLKSGQTADALADLKKLAEKEDGDQLVHMLDYATALQYAGETKESSRIFQKADKFAEMQDYHSVSKLTGSLLFSQEMVQYKGDTFELIFINALNSLNYLQDGNLDDALVEARRINEKYLKLRADEKKKFELNPFSKYLSAMLWEAGGNYDDAYIAYKEAYDLDLGSPLLRKDLLRAALLARRDDEYQTWRSKFPEEAKEVKKPSRDQGELIVLFLQGWGPRKESDPNARTMPILRHVPSEADRLNITISDVGVGQFDYQSVLLYDVEKAAIQTLAEDRASLVGKRIGGVVAKEVMADQIRQKNEALGAVAWIAMYASDRADLRQWSLLPQTIQIVRQPLPAGRHWITAKSLNAAGAVLEELKPRQEFTIKAGRKHFMVVRSLK